MGIAGGWWRAYNSAGTFRFPFRQPNLEKFTPTAFPSAKRAFITGPRAILAWHAARVGLYAMVGSWIGQLLFGSYALSVVGVGEISDKRLQKYVEAVRRRAQKSQGAIYGPQRHPNGAGPGTERDSERGRRPAIDDDASPTGGVYGESEDSMYGMSQNETAGMSEPQQKEPMAPTADSTGAYQTERQPRNFDEDFDDASPTGGRGPAADTGSSSGSTWDRIRRQAASHPAGSHESSWPSGSGPGRGQSSGQAISRNKNGTTSDAASPGDNFSFSSADEDRQMAKGEAQKEFDDRVERERRGGDFNSRSGDQKRW